MNETISTFQNAPKVTDWDSLIIYCKQALEVGMRSFTPSEFAKQLFEGVAIEGASYQDLPASSAVLPIPAIANKYGFLAEGEYTQPAGPAIKNEKGQFGLVYFDGTKWAKKWTMDLPKGLDGKDGLNGKDGQDGKNGKDGQGKLPIFDPNFKQLDGTKGYAVNDQVRDPEGITYVSLKDENESPLSNIEDWKSTGIKLDVDGGALSYELGKRLVDNTVPKEIDVVRVPYTIVNNQGTVVGNGAWDTATFDVTGNQELIITCWQNPAGDYQDWGRPALYDDNLNFLQFLGFMPLVDNKPSVFKIKIPTSGGKLIVSTQTGGTLTIIDPNQDGEGIRYITSESLNSSGSALSFDEFEKVVKGDGLGYGYIIPGDDFEKALRFDGLSNSLSRLSPKIPVEKGQDVEFSLGADGVYLRIINELGAVAHEEEEYQNRRHIKGKITSPAKGFVVAQTNTQYEDGSPVFVSVLNNKQLLTVGDLNKNNPKAFGPVLGSDQYYKDTNGWKVFLEFEDLYKGLIEGELVRVSTTEVSSSLNNFFYYIPPIKAKAGELFRYRLTGYGYEPMYIILNSNNLADVSFIKTFELADIGSVEGEFRVDKDCYIAFNVWNNPQITSLNYIRRGINGLKVNPQYLIEKGAVANTSGSVFKGRKIVLDRPDFMELKVRALPPLDNGTDRTPTYGQVDILMNGELVLTANMKWSVQGHGSSSYAKKGYTFDFLNSEGKSLEIKFGDLISIDSFHLKAYATDTTHTRDVALGRIWRAMINTLPYPYCDVSNNVHTESTDPRKASIYTADAKYHPDGIPCSVYVGENNFGLYTLRLKKTRDNYALDRDNKKHIFLDSSSYTAFYGQAFRPSDWDLKSPRVSGYVEAGPINDTEVLDNINRVFDFLSNLSTRFSEHANFLVLPHWIDFFIHAEVFSNWDINGNNNNLLTWDGIHWTPIPYDLDNTVGLDPWSNMTVRTQRPQSLYINFDIWGTFRTVFSSQIRARYTELRKLGLFTTGNLMNYFYGQAKAIPRDVYDDDRKLWGTIWANDQPSFDQLWLYLESTFTYLDSVWLNTNIAVASPATVNVSVNDAATRLPYVTNGSFVSGGIQASRSAIANNISIRSATGQIKANNAVDIDDLVTLGQINTADTLKPSALNINAGATAYIVPLANNGKFSGGVPLAQAVQNASLVQRTNTGQVKVGDATADNEAITLAQFKGIINNALTASETSTTLNNVYGANPVGQVVRSVTNSVEYTKISITQWKKESLTTV